MKHRRKIITTGAIWSEKLASIDHAAERLYWRIYMASDNYGVMSGKAWDVRQQATPGVAGYTSSSVEKALGTLIAIGLLEAWTDADGSSYIYVSEHDRHQAADFLRKRGRRRNPVPPSLRRRTSEQSESHIPTGDAVPCPSREEGSEGHALVASTTSTTTPTELRDTSTSAKPKRDISAEARQVFDHWVTVWGKRSDTVFEGSRKSNTIARLRSGYTVSQLCEAISGYRFSDHHMGANGKKYDDLELFMRDATKVDAGIQYGVGASNAAAAGGDERTAALVAFYAQQNMMGGAA